MSRIWAFLGLLLIDFAIAASVPFSDCTQPNGTTSNGEPRLQWVTKRVNAVFDPNSPNNLQLTVYGNITGTLPFDGNFVPPSYLSNETYWTDDSQTAGKIIDQGPGTTYYATLFSSWSVALNEIQKQDGQDFCNKSSGCPLTPAPPLPPNVTTQPQWRTFNLSQNMEASYSFSTINAHFSTIAGDHQTTVMCVNIDVTPNIGETAAALVRYLPVMVLVLTAIATISAVFSPWGTWNIYHWTSNYGRDQDQLRLITPGFGDCLAYIQFAVLSSSLRLLYPGFFQPVMSQVAWSTLMFNQSFVSGTPGLNPVQDGVYTLIRNSSSSSVDNLSTMRQVIGMGADYDVWAGFMVWLLVIIGVLLVLIQLGHLFRILYLFATRTQEEDLRSKNWPFTVGNVIRVVFNYFFLPLVSFCIYQMYLAAAIDNDPKYLVALATITLVILLCFAGWLLYQILSTHPRSFLFDDLPTVLLYGPLYNTYSDHAAPFALVPIFVNLLRGVAIGGLQVSGIAQIALLAISEIIVILTLNSFRPFASPTSMNLYHTAISVVRLIVILLLIGFIPDLNASAGVRTILGYVIFCLHVVVLFVGFFLHSLQTLVEVVARGLGAGGEGGDATRGGLVKVFGVRQLSRRNPRRSGRARGSLTSDAAMLQNEIDNDGKLSRQEGMRSRSMSATSGLLLNTRTAGSGRQSLALDTFSQAGPADTAQSGSVGYGPGTPSGAPSLLSYTPAQSQAGFDHRRASGAAMLAGAAGHVASRSQDGADPFFRPPRQRRATNEALSSPRNPSRGSWNSGDMNKHTSTPGSEEPSDHLSEGALRDSAAETPTPAYLGYNRVRADSAPEDPNTPKPDYATREVDYYYGVRGPALNDQPTRKLKTGPADPTGPVSSATGWFRNIFGNKSKDKHKGFEVVRGRGVRQTMEPVPAEEAEMAAQESYRDEQGTAVAAAKTAPRKLDLEDEADAIGAGTRKIPGEESNDNGADGLGIVQHASDAPVLPEIDTGSSIHIPSRIGSRASRAQGSSVRYNAEDAPPVPRSTSTSQRSTALMPAGYRPSTPPGNRNLLSTIDQSPRATPESAQRTQKNFFNMSSQITDRGSSRMPFGSLGSEAEAEATASQAVGSLNARHERPVSGISNISAIEGDGEADGRPSFQNPPSPVIEPDTRRGSVGYVSQHRAGENIVTPPLILGGSTAELVDDSSVAGTDRSPPATPEVRGAPHINF